MDRFLIVSHVLAGSIALISAFGAIAVVKGSSKHVLLGRIYSLAMFFVVIGALILSIIKLNQFLFAIALFSGYLVWTGFRRARFKNSKLNKVDKVTSIVGLIIVIILFSYGSLVVLSGQSIGVVLIFFGVGLSIFVWEDFRAISKDFYKAKFRIANHLQRMLGGTIATITAVTVQQLIPRIQNTPIPEFIIWIAPTIILTPVISYWSRKILS